MNCKFIFLTLVVASPLGAQNRTLRFEHITTNEGLSKSSVTCIMQDRKGFIWVGTFNGLNRYDGYTFHIYQYNQEDPHSLSHNYISSIWEDHTGQIWIGTSDGLNCYNYVSDNFIRFRHNDKPFSISDNQIETIYEDSKNRLWIGTRNGGLNLYNRRDGTFVHFVYKENRKNSISSNFVREVFEDKKGRLWVGHWNGSIDIFNNNKFYRLLINGKNLTSYPITSIVETSNKIWIGTQGDGLYCLEENNNSFRICNHFKHNPNNINSISGNIILSLMNEHDKFLWIGTENQGLNIYDINDDLFNCYKSNIFDPKSLNNNSIYSIYKDRAGNIWIGTYAGGINLVVKGKAYFHHYSYVAGDKYSIGNNTINSFWEDSNGNLWVATGGGGIYILDKKRNRFSKYKFPNNELSSDVILYLYGDREGNLWIGTWGKGLYCVNKNTKQVFHYTKEKNGLGSNNIFQIIENRDDELLLCTFWGGLTIFNKKSKVARIFDASNSSLTDNDLRCIAKDFNGNFWIGTDIGLYLFNPSKNIFKLYKHDGKAASISKGFITCILLASDSTVWVGTTGGLNKYNRKTDSFKHFTSEDGLPSSEIMCIVEDNNRTLWISTTNGISRFNPKQNTFKNYDNSDGLQANEFNARSGYKTKFGEIVFGGNNGFNIFHPTELKDNYEVPPVFITDFKIFNKSVPIGAKDSPLKKNIIETEELILSYKHSVISFDFVALNFNSPEKNQYAYKLEGFDKDWNYIGSNRTATYTNLEHGTYIFRVKASNNDGVWNESGASIKIIIEPPFWKTWWAYVLESLIIAVITYFIANYYLSKQRFKKTLEREHLELEKMYELDQLKSEFFTNISHELKSPLTLIVSPLEKLIVSNNLNNKLKKSLSLVYRNAKRLERLTNQLRDFNKLETKDLKLNLSRGDIVYFIKESSYSFHDYAVGRNIDFNFSSNYEEYLAWFDPDKLDKIIYNLLSNAFKFTSDGGRITITANIHDSEQIEQLVDEEDIASKYVEIVIEDNGIGIPKDKIGDIFKRYYCMSEFKLNKYNGTGIGLAFVYELVSLYKGKIMVESEVDRGTKFTVILPLDDHYLEENQIVAKFNSDSTDILFKTPALSNDTIYSRNVISNYTAPVLLIIDDDKEVREFIRDSLEESYRVFEAEDGQEGYKKATQIIPDLVITDIKMKAMDGITLCKKLKSNERTSHIPIIVLTSYTAQEYQMESLNSGADIYLAKPFSMSLLEAYINNLLETRKKLQEKFSKEFIFGPNKIPLEDPDAKFLSRLIEIIEANIADEKFNADTLSKEIGMSRMQLYRKVRALTDQTVHEFIRNIRLKYAVQLLEQKKMTITEIAYAVGFNDLTYFARCFKKLYGKSPSEYVSSKT